MGVSFSIVEEDSGRESQDAITQRWAEFCSEGPSRAFCVFIDDALYRFERPKAGGEVVVERCLDRAVAGDDGYDIARIRQEAAQVCGGGFAHEELERLFDGFELFVPNWTLGGERVHLTSRERFGFERVSSLETLTFAEVTDVTRRLERAAAFCEELSLLLQFSY